MRSDFLFYGDNTEFHSPFRDGETMFGAAARVAAEISLNDKVVLTAGVFGNQRFGSDDAFEQFRPVISLAIRGERSSFIFGALPASTSDTPQGPDNDGPHQLLPPLQRETLAFERPYEAGLAWNFKSGSVDHHFWLAWQRLNTAEYRERFDGGLRTSFNLNGVVAIPLQLHVVHEGGQLHASGPVADSAAAALGVRLHGVIVRGYAVSVEVLAAGSRYVPDRARPDLSRDGIGFFGRVSAERNGWRGHTIFWRGRNFIKDEGDQNYSSMDLAGGRYRGTRDYAEAGLTRRFRLAPSAVLDAVARVHRVEGRYEYSYRILSVVGMSWRVR